MWVGSTIRDLILVLVIGLLNQVAFGSNPGSLVEPVAVPSSPISLWRIDHKAATVYLLGSIHALSPDLYPLADEIEHAFSVSDKTVFEVDVSGGMAAKAARLMREAATYGPGENLKMALTAGTLVQVERYLNNNGLNLDDFIQMRPWFLTIQISMMELTKIGFDPGMGIDLHFQNLAVQQQKPILQLESLEEQIELLAGESVETQELSLQIALDEVHALEPQVRALIAAWKNGEADLMYELSIESIAEYPQLDAQTRRLLDDRNARMVTKIREFLDTRETYFIVVGALHMGGDAGLLALLGRDYTVEQMHHSAE